MLSLSKHEDESAFHLSMAGLDPAIQGNQ